MPQPLPPLPATPSPGPRLRDDPWLAPYLSHLDRRRDRAAALHANLTQPSAPTLADMALGHRHYGLHRSPTGWVFREWAPHATALSLVGDFSHWEELPAFALSRKNPLADWEAHFPPDAFHHGQHYRLHLRWPDGHGHRLPAWTQRVVQDPATLAFTAQVWDPSPYIWQHPRPNPSARPLLIYEAHIGMAQEHPHVGSYREFQTHVLPRIAASGYNALQIMGVLEHPYYGSFGYHVSNFFAPSSRFGSPEDFKALVDAAHALGLAVIIDLIHSHSVKNESEGLSRFDGTLYQYFHDGPRGDHPAWDSRCFDYAKPQVLHFLLSNCRYWIEDFHLDGFRFDGITSMLYRDHGLGKAFTGYDDYFHPGIDEDAIAYLTLANQLIHSLNPHALTIAEDVSGMPGLAAPQADGGIGFNFRLAMGVPDLWGKLGSDTPDELWNVETLWHELTNRRAEERVISYVESHDQAIVGGKTFISRLLDAAIYTDMALSTHNPHVDRGIALWKLARLLTLATAAHGYLNFIGNEFAHPEWVDFPRLGNHWSGHYARRQWSLRDNPDLKYHALGDFDAAILHLLGDPQTFAATPWKHFSHVADQLLVIQRGPLLLAFNFNPHRSFVDHAVPAPPGLWELILDSDEPRFAGLGRLAPHQSYHSQPSPDGAHLHLYLPARSALVLAWQAPT